MKHFKMSSLHCPVQKMKLRKLHLKIALASFTMTIFVAHYYMPDFEPHMAVATNLLFLIDPIE
jgi:hypothetical protein